MLVKRFGENPILKPNRNQFWESEAVFNGCPIKRKNKIFLLYRAVSLPHYHLSPNINMSISEVGIASSRDGINFKKRRQFIVPKYNWERFGCEDPRITEINGKYYIFYTALSQYPFNAEGIKVGVALSKDLKKVEEKHLVTPFNAKAMALFPEKIKGKMYAVLTVHSDKPPAKICLASFNKEDEIWSESYWQKWYADFGKYALPLQRKPEDHIEVGAPPLKTKYGWLLFYSYIRDYSSPQQLFGVEAVLLDLENPSKIIAKLENPILTPEEYYEKAGLVPNIVFPSGALVNDDLIFLYYGAADTTCCLVFIKLSELLALMLKKKKATTILKRSAQNPIIMPNKNHPWESQATFNPGAVYLENKVHLIYRALSDDNTSSLGCATSKDGIKIDYRSLSPVYTPRESFEQKFQPGLGSGCEDPRLTQLDDKIYMCYTAFNGKDNPRVALTWILTEDFLRKRWKWSRPVLISPAALKDKDAFVFPEKVKGKYMIVHRAGSDIDYSFCQDLDFKKENQLEEFRWIYVRKGWWDSKKVGAAAPPVKTAKGWIMLYHGISEEGVYRVGAVLLDLEDPIKILSRTDNPIFEPEKEYEKKGLVPNVIFPCGNVILGGKLFVYYGGADKVIGVAIAEIDKILSVLKVSKN